MGRLRNQQPPTVMLALVLLLLLLTSSGPAASSPGSTLDLDQYGGLLSITSPNGATGYWRVEKFGHRWLLVTPDGHGFWSFGVFNVVPTGNAVAKYGDKDLTWGPQTARRLRSWGFNTILDHSNRWVGATTTHRSWPDGQQPQKMPSVGFQDAASYPGRNVFNYAPQGAKNIFNGLNRTYYSGWIAPSIDPFDPNFARWINNWMEKHGDARAWGKSPWVIGFSLAEADNMWGFGAGSRADFATVPPGHNSPHLGWIVLLTSPAQKGNPRWRQTYADTTVYAKQALKTFLENRYGTIAALNAAWGSRYTTFDSAGGWGSGTGLLDEDGRHAWVPRDWDNLTGATPVLKQDLDDFLYEYAAQWFRVQRNAVKSHYPTKLYLGPNVLGSWGTPPRRQILQAAGQYIDVFMTQIGTGAADDQQRLDFILRHLGDKPMASWVGLPANPDSALFRHPGPSTPLATNTQAERGQLYKRILNWLVNAEASPSVPGVGGVKPFVGARWWAYRDSWRERTNWGLVTPRENAYDGNEAIMAPGTDPWGYATGGEERDYGDFISAARTTHLSILQALVAELTHRAPTADPTPP